MVSFEHALSDAMPAGAAPSNQAPARKAHDPKTVSSRLRPAVDAPVAPIPAKPSAASAITAGAAPVNLNQHAIPAANNHAAPKPESAPAPTVQAGVPFAAPLAITPPFAPATPKPAALPSGGQAAPGAAGLTRQPEPPTGSRPAIPAPENPATAQATPKADAQSSGVSSFSHAIGQSAAAGQKPALDPLPAPNSVSSLLAGAVATAPPDLAPQPNPIPQAGAPAGQGAAAVGQGAAAQITAAMVGIGPIPIGATQAPGAPGLRLTIAMAPPAIGLVTVQIDRHADGRSVIAVTATHPATFTALQNDRLALEQALTQAGVPVDHRSIAFHLDTAPVAASPSPGQGAIGQNGGSQSGSGQLGMSGGQNGRRPDEKPSGGTILAYPSGEAFGERPVLPDSASPQHPIRMRRFGLNLMA